MQTSGQNEGSTISILFLQSSNLKIDVLVNNAAIIHKSTNLVNFEMEEWEKVIQVNLIGAVKITKLLLPQYDPNKIWKDH